MATLNLTSSYRTGVWNAIKSAIQADTTYDSAGIRIVFFDGTRDSIEDMDNVQGPVLRFLPTAGAVQWFDEASINAALVVNVEAHLNQLDVEDVFNLQEAIEDTLNTLDTPATLQTALITAGAVTGLIVFNQPLRPAPGSPGADGMFRLTGQFTIEVRRPLIP